MKNGILLIILIFFCIPILYGQNNPFANEENIVNDIPDSLKNDVSEYVLVFKHRTEEKEVTINTGQKIKVWYNEYQVLNGEIDSISADDIFIIRKSYSNESGYSSTQVTQIEIKAINEIRYRSKGARTAASILIPCGGVFTILGLAGIISSTTVDENDSLGEGYGTYATQTAGIVSCSIGFGFITAGVLSLSVNNKYDLENEWVIRSEKLTID